MIAKPGAFNKQLQPGLRIQRGVDPETVEERDEKARRNIKAFASWEPDPPAWEADILSALGLDGKTDCPPAPVQLVEPGDATAIHRGRGGKPPEPAAKPGPKPDPLDGIEHTTGVKYPTCRCRSCKDEYNTWHRGYVRRKRADARAAREAGLT